MPSGADYLRILPEIIMTVAGTLIMLIEALAGREQETQALGLLTFVRFSPRLVAAVAANGESGPVVFEHADRGRLCDVLPRAGDRRRHPEPCFRPCNISKREHAESAEYYALLLFSVTGQCVMATANELIMIFIGLEISSIATYILAGYLRDDKRNNEAALKYFLLGSFATAFLLYGIAWIYGTTGSTNLDDIRTASADAGVAAQRDPGRHRSGADVCRIRVQSFGRAVPDLGARCLSGRARAGDVVHVGRPQGRRVRGFPASLHDRLRAHHQTAGNRSSGRRRCSP